MRTRLLPGLVALLVLTLGAGPVLAQDEVGHRGSCSGGPSDWRLRVERASSTSLRVRFEIEHGEPDQVWQLFLSDNGTRIYAGSKESDGEGEVGVRKLTTDRDGRDRVKATGVNLATGESCAGVVRY
jgi:hypothetical protein